MISLNKSVTMTDGGGGIKKKNPQTVRPNTAVQSTAGAGTGQAAGNFSAPAASNSTAGSRPVSVPAATIQASAGSPSAVEKSSFTSSQQQKKPAAISQPGIPQVPDKNAFAQRRYQDSFQYIQPDSVLAQAGISQGNIGIPSAAEKKRFASMQRQPDSTATIQSMVPQAAEKRAFAQRRYQDNQQSSGDQEDLPDSNEPSIGSMAFDTVGWGAGKINGVATSTLDFLANLPSRLEGTLFGEDAEGTFFGQLLKPITDAVGKLNDYTHNTTDKLGTYLNEQTKDNKVANLAVNYGSDLVASAPIAILALLSGGGSVTAQLGPQASGLAETTYQVLSNMAKNPIYWANVAKYLGPKYDQAIANGATENEALVSALLSAPVNAAVDSKGGTEALPQRTRSGVLSAGEKVRKLLSSAVEEGAEGFAQDTLDNLVDKAVYDKDKPYFSTTDEHAVLNPKVAAANAVSDMTTATMLGGGQLLTDAAATRLRNAWEQKRLAWAVSGENLRASDLGEDTVRAALAMPEGTEARSLVDQATIARQAELLGKLEELEAARKQAGAIQTSEQLQAFMKTVGRLEQELDTLEQGRLSDRLDSETLGRLAEAVQTDYAELTSAGAGDKIDSQVSTYIETLKSRNMKLEGMTHNVTGVPFERYQVEMKGKLYEIVAPKFESFYTVQLPEELYFVSNKKQFRSCNLETYREISEDPQLRNLFSKEQLDDLRRGITPSGYAWHHNVVAGEMQLVDRSIHEKTAHTGGRYLWGGGLK